MQQHEDYEHYIGKSPPLFTIEVQMENFPNTTVCLEIIFLLE